VREIKFRALNIYKKEMCYDFILNSRGSFFDVYSECEDTCHCGAQEYGIQRESSIDSDYIMQYTGLKDKNGKEIYEGDLIRLYENNNGFPEVVFKNQYVGGWVLVHGDNECSLGARKDYELEIVGNIHENKDLLK
jgi:uncharacterized phage protein (TIGR01671 family)